VSGEPYHTVQLLYNADNGLYLIRILGKTFARGRLKAKEEDEEEQVLHHGDQEGGGGRAQLALEEAMERLVTAVFHQVGPHVTPLMT
jgi:hypothetical protein